MRHYAIHPNSTNVLVRSVNKIDVPHASVTSVFKRTIDILGALVGLLILALVFVPIAVAIKLDGAGPIFYKQQRYGLHGQPFTLRKFRSMVKNADELKVLITNEAKGLIFKNQHDPRITRVGRFLRRTSLDELPQFWNVLVRLNVKPGLTGEWQVSGRSAIKDFEKIVELDLRYQSLWHPLYDLVIIFKTFQILFTKGSAY